MRKEIEHLKQENRIFRSYSKRKRRILRNEYMYGEYKGISLKSQKEIFHSEFYKWSLDWEATLKDMMFLYQRYRSPYGNGYKYDPTSEITDPYKFRYRTDAFSKNQILSIRHELNR